MFSKYFGRKAGEGRLSFGWPFLLFFRIVSLFVHSGCKTASKTELPATGVVEEQSMGQQWGVEVERIRLTAAGHMVDFRFRVIDPEKAAYLLKRQNKAYLTDQATGTKLLVPNIGKVGSLRQTTLQPEAGNIYFILFSNTGGLVKSGGRVSVFIGDFKAENLAVE